MSGTKPTQSTTDILTKLSPRSVTETVSRLTELLRARCITLFAVIDQRAEAQKVGLDLRETTLVIFGNPVQGTPVMVAAPLAALDLPLKVVVWADGEQSKVSYLAPSALAYRRPRAEGDDARPEYGHLGRAEPLVNPIREGSGFYVI